MYAALQIPALCKTANTIGLKSENRASWYRITYIVELCLCRREIIKCGVVWCGFVVELVGCDGWCLRLMSLHYGSWWMVVQWNAVSVEKMWWRMSRCTGEHAYPRRHVLRLENMISTGDMSYSWLEWVDVRRGVDRWLRQRREMKAFRSFRCLSLPR